MADQLLASVASLPRSAFPLSQFALLARLSHRLGGTTTPATDQQVTKMVARCYRELGRHYVRWAKAFDTALRERKRSGITDDWPAYEAEFMATYTARLNELKPPGWVVTEVAEAPPG